MMIADVRRTRCLLTNFHAPGFRDGIEAAAKFANRIEHYA